MTNPYAVPTPRLEQVVFTLDIVETGGIDGVSARAHGTSTFKRRALWTEAASWSEDSADLRHEPADWIHHIALAALQDRPNNTERLLFSLTGGLGQQNPLF